MCKVLACIFKVSRGVCEDWEPDQKDYQYLKASFCIKARSSSFFQEQWTNTHSPAGCAATKLTYPSKWSAYYTLSKTDMHIGLQFFKLIYCFIVLFISSFKIKHYVYEITNYYLHL